MHPSFFCIGLLQLGQGFELVTNQRQFAASSDPVQAAFSSSGFTSDIFMCHCCHCSQPQGACASPKHSQQKKWALPQSTACEVSGMAFRFGYVFPGVCSASGSLTALPQPGIGHHLMVLLLSTNACNSSVALSSLC